MRREGGRGEGVRSEGRGGSQALPSWGYEGLCVWTSPGCVGRAVIGGDGEVGEFGEDGDVAQFSLLYQHVPVTAS